MVTSDTTSLELIREKVLEQETEDLLASWSGPFKGKHPIPGICSDTTSDPDSVYSKAGFCTSSLIPITI